MEHLRRFFRLFPALAFAMVIASIAFGQEPQDPIDAAITKQAGLIIAGLTPVVVFLFKKYLPAEVLPFLAPMIGAAGSLVLTWISGIPVDLGMGALAGSAGVGVREMYDQGKKTAGVRTET